MKLFKLLTLSFILSICLESCDGGFVFGSDDVIVPKDSGKAYLKDIGGNLVPLNVSYTTDGNGNLQILAPGGGSADDTLVIPKDSGAMYLKGNDGNLYPATVIYTTDGSGNVLPVSLSGVSGGVSSVALTLPSIFTVTGSPITTHGTIGATFASQSQNLVLASPNGSSGPLSVRALVSEDIPQISLNTGVTGSLPYSQVGSGNLDTIAGFDSSGNLESIPGWSFSNEFGINQSLNVDTVTGANFNNFYINAVPTAPSTAQYRNIHNFYTSIDPTNTGFMIGNSSGGGVSLFNMNIDHQGPGEVGQVHLVSGYSNLGDGTTSGITDNFQAFSHGEHIANHYTVNSYQGFSDYPIFDVGSTIGPNGLYGINFGPTFNGTSTGFITGVSIYSKFGASSITPHYHSIESGADVTSGGNIDEYIGSNLYINGATGTNMTGYQFSPKDNNYTNFNGFQISPNGTSHNTNFTGIGIYPSGTYSADNINAININLSPMTSANQKTGLSINDGALNVGSNYDTAVLSTSPGEFQLNSLGGMFHISSGFPMINTLGFGNNLGGSFYAQDNMGDDPTGQIGFVMNGFVGQLAVDPGVTVQRAGFMLAGAGVPIGSGSIVNMYNFKAVGLLNQGGTVSVTNMTGFETSNILCSVATNCWGFYIADPSAHNYLAGDVNADKGFRLSTSGSQPTCDASHRGLMWNIEGGAGVADTFQVCQKNASDVYVWTTH